MIKVVMESWKEGLKKVSLTKLQTEILNISLKEAKENTDALLKGKKITFEIKDTSSSMKFVKEAEKIGVNCFIQDHNTR